MNVPKLRFKEFNDKYNITKVSEIIDVIDGDRGNNYPKANDFYDSEFCLFLNAGNVTKNGFNFKNNQFITKEKDKKLRKGKLLINDIVLTTRGTVGNIAWFNEKTPYKNIRINSGMVINRIKENGHLLPEYLYSYMKSPVFENQVNKMNYGSAQPQLTVSGINKFNIQYPTINEQKKVSTIMLLLDKKIELQSKKIEDLKLFKKGLIDKVIDNLTKYKEIQLGELGETYSGLSGKTKEDFEKGESHYIPFVAILNNKINTNLLPIVRIDKNETQNEVRQYDLFFNTSSETLNEVGLCSTLNNDIKNTYLNSFCFGYRIRNLKEINNEYLNILLHSSIFRKKISVLGQGFTRVNISKNKLMEIKVLVPSFREQLKIVSIINMESNKLSLEENKLLKLQQLKKGLMQSMFV